MASAPYDRDLVGYGASPPDPQWPGGARIAVQVVLNYEEGGENNVLHGDAASEAFLSEIVGAEPWPGMRHMNMESIYEYGSRVGFWRLRAMLVERGIPVTVFAVASAMARNPEAVAAMRDAGWEIASHGLKWIDYRNLPERDEAHHVEEAVRIHARVAGSRPLGFYQGRTSVNTLAIAMREQGFLYCSDSYADELPYWHESLWGTQLIVPYTLDANDMRFATAQGFNCGDQFFTYLKDTFDVLYKEDSARMMSIGLHCRLAGRPGRSASVARFLDYAAGHPGVWFATRLDIARHWVAHHPPRGGWKPSRMPRALFVEVFGGLYEHSPHIAEAVHRAGLSTREDDVEVLHPAFLKVLETFATEDRLNLIRAHPELAGHEAAEGGLTIPSTREQKRLGFDRLSAEEVGAVRELNASYRAKFGYPLIVALIEHPTKASVIEEMSRRLGNGREAEFNTAMGQIARIARNRLSQILPDN